MEHVKIVRFENTKDLVPALDEFALLMDEVSRRAYQLYGERGGTHGSDLDDWLRAERQILGAPAAELTESNGEFRVSVALEGFKASGITVTAAPNEIIISAESGAADGDQPPPVKVMRHVRYKTPVKLAGIEATFENGILAVVLPKLT